MSTLVGWCVEAVNVWWYCFKLFLAVCTLVSVPRMCRWVARKYRQWCDLSYPYELPSEPRVGVHQQDGPA